MGCGTSVPVQQPLQPPGQQAASGATQDKEKGKLKFSVREQAAFDQERPSATVPDAADELTKSRLISSRDTELDKNNALDRTASAALPPQPPAA